MILLHLSTYFIQIHFVPLIPPLTLFLGSGLSSLSREGLTSTLCATLNLRHHPGASAGRCQFPAFENRQQTQRLVLMLVCISTCYLFHPLENTNECFLQ